MLKVFYEILNPGESPLEVILRVILRFFVHFDPFDKLVENVVVS
jgi:hypothetical protein